MIALAIIAVAAFIIYQLVYRGSGGVATIGGLPEQTGGSLPIVTNQQFPVGGSSTTTSFNASGANTSSSSSKFGIVSNDPALDYFVDAANTVTLVKPDGTIESLVNNTTVVLSSSVVSDIITASFSHDGKKVLLSYQVGTSTRTSVFDVPSKTWSHFPDGMLSPVWSPINYQVAYLTSSNSGFETLMTIDAAATSTKPVTIAPLAMEDMSLQWPNKNTIIVSDRPSAFTAGSIWSFDIPSKTLSSVVYEALGSESIWSASNTALLFSASPKNDGGQLSFRNATGSQNILFSKTLPSKCAFGPTTASSTATSSINPFGMIYCAIPSDQGTFSLARLPDEYEQKIYFTNDAFYSINTDTGELEEVFSYSLANLNLDAMKMKVFNNILFFINRYDQKVYALAL